MESSESRYGTFTLHRLHRLQRRLRDCQFQPDTIQCKTGNKKWSVRDWTQTCYLIFHLQLVLPNCEKGETCVRACASDPNCPADSTDFFYMFGPEERSSSYPTTIIFRMGAYLKPNSEVEQYYDFRVSWHLKKWSLCERKMILVSLSLYTWSNQIKHTSINDSGKCKYVCLWKAQTMLHY